MSAKEPQAKPRGKWPKASSAPPERPDFALSRELASIQIYATSRLRRRLAELNTATKEKRLIGNEAPDIEGIHNDLNCILDHAFERIDKLLVMYHARKEEQPEHFND